VQADPPASTCATQDRSSRQARLLRAAVPQIDADDIEIDIDAISADTFWEVDSYVKSVISTSKSKGGKRSR